MNTAEVHQYSTHHPNSIMGYSYSMTVVTDPSYSPILSDPISEVLFEYEDVFEEPSQLTPQRAYDHLIPLKEGDGPVDVRPYRYPQI